MIPDHIQLSSLPHTSEHKKNASFIDLFVPASMGINTLILATAWYTTFICIFWFSWVKTTSFIDHLEQYTWLSSTVQIRQILKVQSYWETDTLVLFLVKRNVLVCRFSWWADNIFFIKILSVEVWKFSIFIIIFH